MFVWSKKLCAGLLGMFVLLLGLFLLQGSLDNTSDLKIHATRWIALNYAGLLVWIFVWMIDQARVRGKNVLLWLLPFLIAPLPSLMLFVFFLQRRLLSS
jgi:fatty acid desaturase